MEVPKIRLMDATKTIALREKISIEIHNFLLDHKIQKPFGGFPFGIRLLPTRTDEFDDIIGWFDSDGEPGHKTVTCFVGSTDPGKFYLNAPTRAAGTAIMKDNYFHKDIWKLGFHKGVPNRPALVQCNPVVVFRDNNRNDVIDLDTSEGEGYGINLHDAGTATGKVGQYSAGCQVVSKKSLDRILTICELINQPTYSYLLLRRPREMFGIL